MKLEKYINVFLIFLLSVFSITATTVLFKFFPNMAPFSPNIILLIVLYISIYRNPIGGALLVFFISGLEGIHSPSFSGGTIIINFTIFTILNYLSKHILVKNIKILFILVLSVVVAETFLFVMVTHFLRFSNISSWFIIWRAIIQLPMNIVFAPFVFNIIKKIDLYTGFKKEAANFFSGPIYLRKG